MVHNVKLFREAAEHRAGIRALNESAFGRVSEAELVDVLRDRGKVAVSLVAVDGAAVVGHVIFTPVHIEGAPEAVRAAGLGPVAVTAAYRGYGIATRLIQLGLKACGDAAFNAVFVLGDPRLYSRLGFEAASHYGIRCEYPAPAEIFMVRELWPGALAGASGVAKYAPEFAEALP